MRLHLLAVGMMMLLAAVDSSATESNEGNDRIVALRDWEGHRVGDSFLGGISA
jgi:hypothetical protein